MSHHHQGEDLQGNPNKEKIAKEISLRWKSETDKYTKAVLRGRHPRSFNPHRSELWSIVSESEGRKAKVIQGQLLSQIVRDSSQRRGNITGRSGKSQRLFRNQNSVGVRSMPQLPAYDDDDLSSVTTTGDLPQSSPTNFGGSRVSQTKAVGQSRQNTTQQLSAKLDRQLAQMQRQRARRNTLQTMSPLAEGGPNMWGSPSGPGAPGAHPSSPLHRLNSRAVAGNESQGVQTTSAEDVGTLTGGGGDASTIADIDLKLDESPVELAKQLSTQSDGKLHYGLHIALQQKPPVIAQDGGNVDGGDDFSRGGRGGKFLAVHKETGEVKVEYVQELTPDYQIVFKVVNLENLENADSVKYHSQIWLQVKASTQKGAWLDGQVLGIRFHQMSELPTEKIIIEHQSKKDAGASPAGMQTSRIPPGTPLGNMDGFIPEGHFSNEEGMSTFMTQEASPSSLRSSIASMHNVGGVGFGRQISGGDPHNHAHRGEGGSSSLDEAARHREKLTQNMLLPIDMSTTDEDPQKQGGITISMDMSSTVDDQTLILDDTTSVDSKEEKVKVKDHPAYTKFFSMLQKGMTKEDVQSRMAKEGYDMSMLDDPEAMIELNESNSEKNDQNFYQRVKLCEHPKYARYFTMLKELRTGETTDVIEDLMLKENLDPNILDRDPDAYVYLHEKKVKSLLTESEQKAKRSKHVFSRASLNKNALIRARWIVKPIKKRLSGKKAEVCNMDEVWLEQDFFYLASQKFKSQACVRQRDEKPVHREHQGEGRHIDRRGVFRIRLADFYIDTAGMSKEQKNVEKLMKKAKTQLVGAHRVGDPSFDFATDPSMSPGSKNHGLAYGGLVYANELRSGTILKSLNSEAGLLCKNGQIIKSEDPEKFYGMKNRQVEQRLKKTDELKSLSAFPELVDQISLGKNLGSQVDDMCSLPTSFSYSLNKSRLAELTRASGRKSHFPRIKTLKEQQMKTARPQTSALLRHYVQTGTFNGFQPEAKLSKTAESSLEDLHRNPGHFAHLHELGGRCGMCRLWRAKGCLCDIDRTVQEQLREEVQEDRGAESSEPLKKINMNLSQTRRTNALSTGRLSARSHGVSRQGNATKKNVRQPVPSKGSTIRSRPNTNHSGQELSIEGEDSSEELSPTGPKDAAVAPQSPATVATDATNSPGHHSDDGSTSSKWSKLRKKGIGHPHPMRKTPSLYTVATTIARGGTRRRKKNAPDTVDKMAEIWSLKYNMDYLMGRLQDQDTSLSRHIKFEEDKVNMSEFQDLYSHMYRQEGGRSNSARNIIDHWKGLQAETKKVNDVAAVFKNSVDTQKIPKQGTMNSILEISREGTGVDSSREYVATDRASARHPSDVSSVTMRESYSDSISVATIHPETVSTEMMALRAVDPQVYDHRRTLQQSFGNRGAMLNEMLQSFHALCTQKIVDRMVQSILEKDIKEISRIGDFLIQAMECLIAEQLKTAVFDLHQDVQKYWAAKASNSLGRAEMQELKAQILLSSNHVLVELRVFLSAIEKAFAQNDTEDRTNL